MRTKERAARCTASPCHEGKPSFRVRYRAVPEARVGPGGGATYQWRLNETPRGSLSWAGSGRQKSSNLTQIGGFSPRRACSNSHSCDLKLARACSSCRAAYGQLQEGRRPSTAQAKPNTSRPRTRTPTRDSAAFTKRRPRSGTSVHKKHPRRLVLRDAPSHGLLRLQRQRKCRRAARTARTPIRVRSLTSGSRARGPARQEIRRRDETTRGRRRS